MCGGARAAQALQHVNLLLVLFAGGCLVTGARLRWDPSAYVPLRELLPAEYRVLAVAVPAAGAAMLALAHLALAAAAPRRSAQPRRALLTTYACLMAAAIILELSLVGWVWARVSEFTQSPEAEEMEQLLATREHLQPLLEHLARWHPISEHLKDLLKEAEADVPWNGYVAAAAMVALLILQLFGVMFALLATRSPNTKRHNRVVALSASRESLVDSLRSSLSSRGRSPAPQTPGSVRSFRSVGGKSDEWAPLRAKYINGRIVPV